MTEPTSSDVPQVSAAITLDMGAVAPPEPNQLEQEDEGTDE